MLLRSRPVTLLVSFLIALNALTAAEPSDIAALRAKADKGNAVAQYNLGLIYLEGQRVPVDPAEAFAWLTLASENGSKAQVLQSLLGTITTPQLAEGRNRLAQYRTVLASKGKLSTSAPAVAAPQKPSIPVPAPTTPPKAVTASAPTTATVTLRPDVAATAGDSAELTSLRNDRHQLSDELSSAWKENTQLKKDLSAAQTALADAKERDAEHAKAIAKLQEQTANAVDPAELRAARKEAESARAAATAVATKLAAVESASAALQKENQRLTTEQKEAESAQARAVAHAASQAREAANELATLKTQLASAEAARSSLASQKSAAEGKLRQVTLENDSLENRLARTAEEITKRDLQLKEQAAELRSVREKVESAKTLATARDNAEAERTKLAVTVESQQREISTLKQQVASAVETARAAAEAKIAAEQSAKEARELRAQVEALKARVAESETARNDLAAKQAAAVERAQTSAEQLAALRALAKTADTSRVQIVSEREGLMRQLEAARGDLTSAARQSDILKAQLAAATADASAARKDAADARIKLMSGESARRDLIAELVSLRAQVKQATPANSAITTKPAATRTHTIAVGDTLLKISQHYYGTPNRWTEILAANQDVLRDEHGLVAGRVLRIP